MARETKKVPLALVW